MIVEHEFLWDASRATPLPYNARRAPYFDIIERGISAVYHSRRYLYEAFVLVITEIRDAMAHIDAIEIMRHRILYKHYFATIFINAAYGFEKRHAYV